MVGGPAYLPGAKPFPSILTPMAMPPSGRPVPGFSTIPGGGGPCTGIGEAGSARGVTDWSGKV